MSSWTRIDHLGHTTFRLSVPNLTILIDPVLVQPGLRFTDRRTPEWWFPEGTPVDAVFISHGHSDHLHPPTLLGLPTDTAVFAYEEDASQRLVRLGFQNVTRLDADSVIQLNKHLTIRVIPVAPSGEGTLQCAFLIETPDAIILDMVDAADSEVTRTALLSWRNRVDLVFLPSGASFQWSGYWNQMDPIAALQFAQWLEAGAVAPCGGSLSASAARAPGSLQRYPADRADWYAVASSAISPARLISWKTPFSLVYAEHRLTRRGPLPVSDFSSQARIFDTQALAATFFTGFDLSAPVRSLREEPLSAMLTSWQPARGAIRESAPLLTNLIRRCHPVVAATPASRVAPRVLRRLCEAEQFDLAGEISSFVPESPAPEHLAVGFFDIAEVLMRSDKSLDTNLRQELITCIFIDRALSALERESLEMKQLPKSDPQTVAAQLDQHIEQLRLTADVRRPVLSANHLYFRRSELPLLLDTQPAADTAACLAVATDRGVRFIMLREQEAELLKQCDGRTLAEISDDLSSKLSIDRETARTGLLELLIRLSRVSVQFIDWSA